jgi:hypothetical protein
MTSPKQPAAEIHWETIERVADKAERSRLESLSNEELDHELRQAGIDPEEADQIVREALSETSHGTAAANGVGLRVVGGTGEKTPRVGRSRMVWAKVSGWVAATTVAAGLLVQLLTGPVITGTSPVKHAAKLRAEAATACSKKAWTECEQKLNEARDIDPAGESDPPVVEERKAIAARGH